MKRIVLLLFCSSVFFLPAAAQQEEEPPAPNNELMVQTMNASASTTRYELVPIGAMHCRDSSPCSYAPYSDPPTQSLSLSGNVICGHVGFGVRTCTQGDYQVIFGCATSTNGVRALRYGFYRINIYVNDELRRYFYYDTRDCGLVTINCGGCSGNDITIRYDAANNICWWYNGFNDQAIPQPPAEGWESLAEGQILTYRDIKNCSPSCFQPFWNNGLVVIPKANGGSSVPYLVWGPYSAFQPSGYRIYRRLEPAIQFSLRVTVAASVVSFQDNEIEVGTGSGEFAHYYVEAFDAANNSSLPTNEASIGYSLHTEKRSENNQRGTLQISEAYPNPFNPSTTIKFVTPTDGKVKLTVHNLLGQEVATLTDEYKTAGQHEVVFNAEGLPSGAYLYRFTTASGSITKRMVLMK